ncbi:MAG TPA: hypothetical protein VF585_10700, partial [Chthoniobacterales bacterium]
MTRFFIRLLNWTLLACFLGFVWGGWYLSKQGFGRKWRKKLSEEFSRRGVEMSTRRLTLDPLRGLVAHDVRVFRDDDQEQTVARIDELRLDINYTRLLRNEPFLDALILSKAEVRLDVDPKRPESGEFVVSNLAAQLFFQQDRVEIRRMQGEGLGMIFTIQGVLEHRADWRTAARPSEVWGPFRKIPRGWLEAISQANFGSQTGRMDLRFRGNLSQKEWLQAADVRVQLPEVRWKGIHATKLTATMDLADHLLTVRQLEWQDGHGNFSAAGTWRLGKEGRMSVDSHIDPVPVFRERRFLPKLQSAARVHLRGDISWKRPRDWKWVGTADAHQVLYRGVLWHRVQGQFSVVPGKWFAREIHLEQKGGSVTGAYLQEGRTRVEAEMTSTVNPRSFWRSLGKEEPSWLADFDFAVNPW